MARKILYSPGFGAGWSSWNTGRSGVASFMLEYQPIIEFIESGGKFSREECDQDKSTFHPLLRRLCDECNEKFGENYVCVLGADDLRVKEVSGRVRINEYDGSESVEEEGEYSDWM